MADAWMIHVPSAQIQFAVCTSFPRIRHLSLRWAIRFTLLPLIRCSLLLSPLVRFLLTPRREILQVNMQRFVNLSYVETAPYSSVVFDTA